MTKKLIKFEKKLVETEIISERQLRMIMKYIESDEIDNKIKEQLIIIYNKEIYRKTYATRLRSILKRYDEEHLLNTYSTHAKNFKKDMAKALCEYTQKGIIKMDKNGLHL